MWYLEKEVTISASHHIKGYDGPCAALHGHNWKITVYCKGHILNELGMLIDFRSIKETVNNFDHTDLNFKMRNNATAELLAELICNSIPYCYKVLVEEQEGARCIYVKD